MGENPLPSHAAPLFGLVLALGEAPGLQPWRSRSRGYLVDDWALPGAASPPGKTALVEVSVEPTMINNEEEAYGRNAVKRCYYYRIAIPLAKL
jgi:hypothetical protein